MRLLYLYEICITPNFEFEFCNYTSLFITWRYFLEPLGNSQIYWKNYFAKSFFVRLCILPVLYIVTYDCVLPCLIGEIMTVLWNNNTLLEQYSSTYPVARRFMGTKLTPPARLQWWQPVVASRRGLSVSVTAAVAAAAARGCSSHLSYASSQQTTQPRPF